MKNKNFVSLSLSLAFLALSVTGLLLYLVKHNKETTSIHVVFGLLFLSFAVFHISNNWSSLISYAKSRTGGSLQRELLLSITVVGIFLAGTWLGIPPFSEVEELGEEIRNGDGERKRETRVTFNEIETNQDNTGKLINLILQKDKSAVLPVIAIWVEDSTHTFVENLFVPSKTLSTEEKDIQEAIREGEMEEKLFDASLLPTWSARAKSKNPNFENATPVDNFILKTKTSALGVYSIFIEISTAGSSEIYEALVSTSKETAITFKSKDGKFLTRALVEIN
jgi:hypothetical protein